MNWLIPLRRLLWMVMVGFAAILASIQYFSTVQAYTAEGLAQAERMARYSAGALASNLDYALARGDERLLHHFLAQQVSRPNLRYALYADIDGVVRAATAVGFVGRELGQVAPDLPAGLREAVAEREAGMVVHQGDTRLLWAVFPVRQPPRPGEVRATRTGTVVILSETEPLYRAALASATTQALTLLLPMLLLALALTLLIKWMLTDRIEQLLAYTREQMLGSALPAPVTGRDELGQLGERLAALMREVIASRDFHIRLLDKMPNPIWRSDASGQCTYFNAAWLALTGRSLAQELGEGWSEGVHPDDLARVSHTYADAFAARKPFYMTYRLRHCDGSYHTVADHGEPIHAGDGRFAGYLGSCFDIEEQCRAARVLATSEAKFRGLVERSIVGVYLIVHGRLMYVNPQLQRWLGYGERDLTGMEVREIVHPADIALVQQRLRERIEGGHPDANYVFRLLRADRSHFPVEVFGSRIDLDGQPAIIGIMLDITERQAAYEEIQRLNAGLETRVAERTAQLAAVNKELETFAYSVSHDLKAPLRGIDGYSHLLLEDHAASLNEEGLLFVNNIRAGVAQMGRLIDDLLAYSRIERRSLQRIPLDLARSVEGILAERAGDERLARVRLRRAVPAITVMADPDGLAQVLRNLIDNAIKYSAAATAPDIEIGARQEAGTCLLWVRDNGIGFDMQFHERIFEVFQRLQRAEDYAGTGVGLAIVRKAIQRMGGRVWAESAPGCGACFYVELPT